MSLVLDDDGVLRLAVAACLYARRDADAGDVQAAEFLRSDFAFSTREMLECRPNVLRRLMSFTSFSRSAHRSSSRQRFCLTCGKPLKRKKGKRYCSANCYPSRTFPVNVERW